MDREAMVDVAMEVIARQDTQEVDGIVELFSRGRELHDARARRAAQGREALRQNVLHGWPESTTEVEWTTVEGNRLTLCWRWQGKGEEFAGAPPLRGVSTFVFDDNGLVAEYEDWFDPGWMNREPESGDFG